MIEEVFSDHPRRLKAFCWEDGCHNPATHERVYGLADDGTEIVELVCYKHRRTEG